MWQSEYHKIVHNPIFHDKTKHIEVQYHFVCEQILPSNIVVNYIPTYEQVVDILKKVLGRIKFEKCRSKLGMKNIKDIT